MGLKDIIVLTIIIIISFLIIGAYIYKRIKGLPTGECSCCKSRMKKAMKKAKKNCCCK